MITSNRQALQIFKAEVLPSVREQYEQDGEIDRIARREEWNNWLDALCKDGQITQQAYDTWDCPW